MLQPINDHQLPVKIQPEFTFKQAPITKCVYHPLVIQHFCQYPTCLMPLCSECIQTHPREHSRHSIFKSLSIVESIEDSLSDVYAGYAARANEIATHSRNDLLGLRKDLHKLIDRLVEDVLEKADNNYEEDLVKEWRSTIQKLERLKDSNKCLQQLIYYHTEAQTPYQPPKLYYDDQIIKVNHEALEQVRYHLNHLFMVSFEDGNQYFSINDRPKRKRNNKNKYKRNKSTSQIIYQPFNYTTSPIRVPVSIVQMVQPQQQQLITQQLPQQPQFIQTIPQQFAIPQTQSQYTQPLVVYQESPIKFINQQQPPLIKTPQTVTSIYPGTPVQPFLSTSQQHNEYAHPYILDQQK